MSGPLLSELRVRRFAIIDEARVLFAPGFNVLTGETGAGKSILIDALNMALGGRASTDVVAAGAEEATVEAVFHLGDAGGAAAGLLEREGLHDGQDGVLVLGRTISPSGRHLAHVNGRMATARLLRDLGDLLVDVHGQHEHQQLLSAAAQRDLVDRFAREEGQTALAAVEQAWREWNGLVQERDALAGDPRERARREDLLRFQLREIDAARLSPGDAEEMAARRQVLLHGQRLFEMAALGHQRLAGGGAGEHSVIDGLAAVHESVRQAAAIDPSLAQIAQMCAEALSTLREAARDLRAYRDTVRFDPKELAEIEERWDLVHRLKRKYGDSVEEILKYRDEVAATLERSEQAQKRAAALDAEEESARAALARACLSLREIRKATAARLASRVNEELRDLGFPEASFDIAVRPRLDPGGVRVGAAECAVDAHGADEVEFMLAPNPGERPRTVRAAASGGELSRVMLGIRAAFTSGDEVPVLVFDEIDSGIGGRTAIAVGQRLERLGADRQVLCVTHLPQIASRASHHVAIRKKSSRRRTSVQVVALDDDARRHEIARMLSGVENATSLEHARALLDRDA